MRFAVIGAGMAGILSGVKLQEAGHDFTIFEKADRFGGTWRENTYPGLSCDVPSHLYSYSFALSPDWSHRFSPGPEIHAYLERVAREHDLERHVRFGDEVCRCEFSDGGWQIETASGHRDEFDVVIAATGVLHHPRFPDIEGLESFDGAMFHSSRWDHAVPLDGARVGVIGTGSTAIQITSALVERVEKLSLFQRTAQWVMPAENPAYTDEERAAFRADPAQLTDVHANLANLFGIFANAVVDAGSPEIKMIEEACLANLEDNVRDPELRERLRPDYKAACKRLIISPDFYDAIQHPNAELVTERIERIEPEGVRTSDGALHELDVLVLATGFKTHGFVAPMEIAGSGGRSLAQEWAGVPRAYFGLTVPGFPNLFVLYGPNTNGGTGSVIYTIEAGMRHVLAALATMERADARRIEVRREAADEFDRTLRAALADTVWHTGCTNWYVDENGHDPNQWPWLQGTYRRRTARIAPGAYELGAAAEYPEQ